MPRILIIRLSLAAAALALVATLARVAGGEPSVQAGRVAGIAGAGASGVMVVNLDPAQSAEVSATFYRQGGGEPVLRVLPAIAPRHAYNVYLPAEPPLANGAYGLLASGDRPIELLARTEWAASGASALYRRAPAAREVVMPVLKSDEGRSSLVSIQNTNGGGAANVTVTVTAADGGQVLSRQYLLDAGTSITLDLGASADFAALRPGFRGLLRAAADSPLAVNSFVDFAASRRAVAAFNGLPATAAARTVLAPRVDAGASVPGHPTERNDSQIWVANPGPDGLDVTITYRGIDGACAGATVIHGGRPFAVAAGGLALFEPRVGGLAAGCRATATIEATGGITAVVLHTSTDRVAGGVTASGAYTAFSASEAARQVLLPLYRREHTALKLTTDVTAMNLGPVATTATLALFDWRGAALPCGAPCAVTLPPGGGHTWQAEDTAFAANAWGSAAVGADQPLAVVVDDGARAGAVDTSTYEGIPADGPAASGPAAMPLVLRSATGMVEPTPTPATQELQIAVVGMIDVAGGADPACAGCNGTHDEEDAAHGAAHPLPAFSLVVRDAAGQQVASAETTALTSGIQRALLSVPELAADGHYVVSLAAPPADWALCWADAAQRTLRPADFPLRTARVDLHFTAFACRPPSATPTAGPAVPTATPAIPGAKMAASSGVMGLNLGAEPATIQVEFFGPAGGSPVAITRADVAPGRWAMAYLPAEPTLRDDLFALVATSSQALGLVANAEWYANGALARLEGAVPSTDVIVPLAAKGDAGRNTIVGLQNMAATAAADISLRALDGAGEEVASATFRVPAGATRAVDIGRDPALAALPLGFAGSLRITAATRVAAQALLDYEHSHRGMAGYSAMPAALASRLLFAPRVYAGPPADPDTPAAGATFTRLAVTNPTGGEVEVTTTYRGTTGACAGQTYGSGGAPHVVPPGGMKVIGVAADGLPAGCEAAARLEATAAVLAVAVDTVEAGTVVRTAAAYNLFAPAQAGRRVAIPLIRRQHTSFVLSTDVSAQNLGDQPVTMTLRPVLANGNPVDCGSACEATVAPGASHTFVAEAINNFGSGWYGWGTLEASGPVVVSIEDSSRTLAYDKNIGPGLAMPPVGTGPGPAQALPLAPKNTDLRLPGPFLVPYTPPAAEPPASSPLAAVPHRNRLFLPAAERD